MTCSLRVLGCSGGIAAGLRTTSFLLNDDTLIDAGTGVGDLTLDELRKIDRIFLTHSHLDHICSVGFLADSVGASRTEPITVFGIPETLDNLQKHILNHFIWPDFTAIPSVEHPFLRLQAIEIGQIMQFDRFSITALPVKHSIAANGYAMTSDTGTLVFSGDTGPHPEFWQAIKQYPNLEHLLIETSFTATEQALADVSGHYSSQSIVTDLENLKSTNTRVWISHLKPDGGQHIIQEILGSSKHLPQKIASLEQDQILMF